jgi:serine/threonine protein kinase
MPLRLGILYKIGPLQLVHENLIIHRDIKPSNILVDHNGDVKICDLGCAMKLESKDHRIKGTEGILDDENLRDFLIYGSRVS